MSELCLHTASIEAGYRYCLTCSEFLPVPIGQKISSFRVEEVFKHLSYFFYRVWNEEAQVHQTILEFREYFDRRMRVAQDERVSRVLKGLFFERLKTFYYETSHAVMGYFVFSEDLWTFLSSAEPLRDLTHTLKPSELSELKDYYQRCLRQMEAQQLSNPGLTLHSTFRCPETGLIRAIDWAFCMPHGTDLVYPHLYLGYHNHLMWLKQHLHWLDYNQRLTQLSVFYSFLEAVVAKPSHLFYPGFVTLRYYRSVFRRQFVEQVDRFLEQSVSWDALDIDCDKIFVPGQIEGYRQANLCFYEALDHVEHQAFEKATTCINQAISHYFNDPLFYLIQSHIYRQSGEQEKAMQALSKGVELHRLFVPFHLEMANLLISMERYNDALTLLMFCLQEDQYCPELHYGLGQCYEKLELPIQAERCYALCIKQRPIPDAVAGLERVSKLNGTASDYNLSRNHFKQVSTSVLMSNYDSDYYQEMGWIAADFHFSEGNKVGDYTVVKCLRKKDFDKKKYKAMYLAEKMGQQYMIEAYDTIYPYVQNLYDQQFVFYRQVQHDSVLSPVDAFIDKQISFLVFPFLECLTLQDYLEQNYYLSPRQLWQLLISVGSLLFYLSNQEVSMVHGDIKPANILVTAQFEVFVTDWESLTHLFVEPQVFRSTKTFPYSAPEQEYQLRVYKNSDVFALGMMLIQAVTGLSPDLFIHYPEQRIESDWKKFAVYTDPQLFKEIDHMVTFEVSQRAEASLPQLKDWLAKFKIADTQQKYPLNSRNQKLAEYAYGVLRASEQEDVARLRESARALLQMHPETRLYYFVAGRFFVMGLVDEAIMMANHGIRSRQFVQAYWLLAQCLHQKLRFQDAEFVLIQSLEAYKKHAFPYILLARNYFAQHQHRKAIPLYERALHLMRTLPLLFEYVKCLIEANAFNSALEQLDIIFSYKELSPVQRGEAYHLEGVAYARQEKYHSALNALKQAVNYLIASRANLLVYLDLGMTAVHAADYTLATQALQTVLELDPQQPTALYWMTHLALEQQDADKAKGLIARLPRTQLSVQQLKLVSEQEKRLRLLVN